MEYSHRPFEEIDVRAPRGSGDVALCWTLVALGGVLLPLLLLFVALVSTAPLFGVTASPGEDAEAAGYLWAARVAAGATTVLLLGFVLVRGHQGRSIASGWVTVLLAGVSTLLLLAVRTTG
jgi:hypothetical protein